MRMRHTIPEGCLRLESPNKMIDRLTCSSAVNVTSTCCGGCWDGLRLAGVRGDEDEDVGVLLLPLLPAPG